MNNEIKTQNRIENYLPDMSIKIKGNKYIDCSGLTQFDDLEYDAFHLFEKLCSTLGIELEKEDDNDVDYFIAKQILDTMFLQIQQCGFKLNFDPTAEFRYIAYNIMWDIDEINGVELPDEIVIPYYVTSEDEITDYLSDVTGCLHEGYRLRAERIK